MDYHPFEIHLRPSGKGVQIGFAERGREVVVSHELDTAQLAATADQVLESMVKVIRRTTRELESASSNSDNRESLDNSGPSARTFGAKLYQALAAGSLKAPFTSQLGRVLCGNRQGVRIRLVIHPSLCDAFSLPWELLYRSSNQHSLGRCRLTPLSLSIPDLESSKRFVIRPPLRVLVAGPAPKEGRKLELEKEQAKIQAALRRHPAMDVDFVEAPVTVDRLLEKLEEDEFQILHFMGHGGFQRHTGIGYLCFEDQLQHRDVLLGEVLGEHLRCYSSLRLVVLNSCSSGDLPRERGQDPFSGVGMALLQAGLPAVVAMRVGISDSAAIHFAEHFYAALANGRPVDVAATHGRLAMYRKDLSSTEWAIPTVFMQVPDGRIQIAGKVPVRLGIRSRVGWDEDMEKRCMADLSLVEYFQGRPVQDLQSWGEMHRELDRFLKTKRILGLPIHLELPAHLSIAFAAGYILEAKSGYQLSVRQRGLRGPIDNWRIDDPVVPEAPTWADELEVKTRAHAADPGGGDLAVAISLTKQVLSDVESYLDAHSELRIGALIHAVPQCGPGQRLVLGGGHAHQLAVQLVNVLEAWKRGHKGRTIHLFTAAPNGFLVFLGRLARGLGKLQLYEHDFEDQQAEAYAPSFCLQGDPEPLPTSGDPKR